MRRLVAVLLFLFLPVLTMADVVTDSVPNLNHIDANTKLNSWLLNTMVGVDPRLLFTNGAICGPVSIPQANTNTAAVNSVVTLLSTSTYPYPRVIVVPCEITITTTIVVPGSSGITFWAPPESGGGFNMLNPTLATIRVQGNGLIQAPHVSIDGLSFRYTPAQVTANGAIRFLDSGGIVSHVRMMDGTVNRGIVSVVTSAGANAEQYFLLINDFLYIVTGVAITATTDHYGQILDLDVNAARGQAPISNLFLSGGVVANVWDSVLVGQRPPAGGSNALIVDVNTAANPGYWLNVWNTELESADCYAINAAYINAPSAIMSVTGGAIYLQQNAGCPTVYLGDGMVNTLISGVNFHDNAGQGIHADLTSSHATITGNSFTNHTGYSVRINTNSLHNAVFGNSFENSGTLPITVVCPTCANVVGPNRETPGTPVAEFRNGISINPAVAGTMGLGVNSIYNELRLNSSPYAALRYNVPSDWLELQGTGYSTTGGVAKVLCIIDGRLFVGASGSACP